MGSPLPPGVVVSVCGGTFGVTVKGISTEALPWFTSAVTCQAVPSARLLPPADQVPGAVRFSGRVVGPRLWQDGALKLSWTPEGSIGLPVS